MCKRTCTTIDVYVYLNHCLQFNVHIIISWFYAVIFYFNINL